ncbi:hypothetical protein F4561_000053 [Lipingzhangella halophila]|uniref:Uncharacterized protein n=1 Tax=Lipingzhangella halophila TaxID=1783352 RepID=A0A7W7W0I7_9ACTN|nr:hypothetical protein [Lipingzhangella halophila]MBB4929233.1 hypothetical protein [Lipingzhangella halophila]
MSLDEAARQLEAAVHDARVSFDCIELEDLDRAHTNAITARAAVDAAEYAIRVELERRQEQEADEEAASDAEAGASAGGESADDRSG